MGIADLIICRYVAVRCESSLVMQIISRLPACRILKTFNLRSFNENNESTLDLFYRIKNGFNIIFISVASLSLFSMSFGRKILFFINTDRRKEEAHDSLEVVVVAIFFFEVFVIEVVVVETFVIEVVFVEVVVVRVVFVEVVVVEVIVVEVVVVQAIVIEVVVRVVVVEVAVK